MPLGDTPNDVPADNQSFLGSQGMQQAPTDNLAALGLQRDPSTGRWTYHSSLPPVLTSEELGSMPFGELRGQIYRDSQTQYQDYIKAGLAKQAEGLNIAEESKAMTENALEGYGTEARRRLDASYEQQLAKVDPRMAGTTISSAQRGAATRDYRQASSDLERQITQTKANVMRPEYRNIQDLITQRVDTPPDMSAIQRSMMEAGASGMGSSGVDAPEWWEGPAMGAGLNWLTTPRGAGQDSPLMSVVNWALGTGNQQQGGPMGGGWPGNTGVGPGGVIIDGAYPQQGGGWFGPQRGAIQQGLEAGGEWLYNQLSPPPTAEGLPDFDQFGGPNFDDFSQFRMGGGSEVGGPFIEGGGFSMNPGTLAEAMEDPVFRGQMPDDPSFWEEAVEWIEEEWDDLLGYGALAYKLGGTALAAAGPYVAAAAAVYAAYELWDHNREDIRREVNRMGRQYEEFIDDTYHDIEDEYKRTVDTIEDHAEDMWEDIEGFGHDARDVLYDAVPGSEFVGDVLEFGAEKLGDEVSRQYDTLQEETGRVVEDVGDEIGRVVEDIGDEIERGWKKIF